MDELIHKEDIPMFKQKEWIDRTSEVKDKLDVSEWLLLQTGAPFVSDFDIVYAPARYFGAKVCEWETHSVVKLWKESPGLKQFHENKAKDPSVPLECRLRMSDALRRLTAKTYTPAEVCFCALPEKTCHFSPFCAQEFTQGEVVTRTAWDHEIQKECPLLIVQRSHRKPDGEIDVLCQPARVDRLSGHKVLTDKHYKERWVSQHLLVKMNDHCDLDKIEREHFTAAFKVCQSVVLRRCKN